MASNARLEYTVSMKRAQKHYFDIGLKAVFEEPKSGQIRFTMPVWIPGHYVIDDFAKNVIQFEVKEPHSGRPLPVYKESKNVWVALSDSKLDSIQVDYSVYSLNYSNSASYIDVLHAIINGPSLFVYPVGMEKGQIELRLVPHGEWKKVTTALEMASEFVYRAGGIDELMDSPIEVGNQKEHTFMVGNTNHIVSTFGSCPINEDEFVRDIKKIVETESEIFQGLPYHRYVFIVNFTDDVSGGLEHMNSTVCFVPRLRLLPRQEYNTTMGLFSHEFFHAWNVKRIRPREISKYDYSKENYTKSLWIAEGITSYYDDLVLRRAGIFTTAEYLDAFSFNVNLMKSYPGSRVQSAEEASFDTWIKYYKPDSNAPNVTMSYYIQGAVVGWMLDMQIRKNTRSRRSLDDVMRALYRETYLKDGRGYSEEDFERLAIRIGGKGVKEVFDSRVRGKEEVDFDRYFGYAGLKVEGKQDKGVESGFLGLRLANDGSKSIVGTVLTGYPAESMGLTTGDEIIGIDGLRLGGERLSFYVFNKKPESEISILIARNGELIEVEGQVGKRPPLEYRITPLPDATEEQKRLYKGWLNDDWASTIVYPEYRKSPDRKPILDFI